MFMAQKEATQLELPVTRRGNFPKLAKVDKDVQLRLVKWTVWQFRIVIFSSATNEVLAFCMTVATKRAAQVCQDGQCNVQDRSNN